MSEETTKDAPAPRSAKAAEDNNVISKTPSKQSFGIEVSEDGTINSRPKADKVVEQLVPAKPKKAEEKVAIVSNGNIHWDEVGVVNRGFNFVSKAASEKWLEAFDTIRLATPDEVAKALEAQESDN